MGEKLKKTSKKKPGPKKTTGKKSTATKKRATTGVKKDAKASKKTPVLSNHSPILALTVMALLAVVAVLSSRLYNGDRGSDKSSGNRKDTLITSKDIGHKVENIKIINDKKRFDNSAQKEKTEKEKGNEETRPIKIYLIHVNNRTEKISLAPVIRNVNSKSLVNNAVAELIRGPNSKERNRGLLTAVPRNLRINSIRKKRNVAFIDFDQSIEIGANGNILLSRIDQIVYTVTQFENIDAVRITINGKQKHFLGSDGLSINRPLERRKY